MYVIFLYIMHVYLFFRINIIIIKVPLVRASLPRRCQLLRQNGCSWGMASTESLQRWEKEFFLWVLIEAFMAERNQERLAYLAFIKLENSECGRRWKSRMSIGQACWKKGFAKCCRCCVEGWRPVYLVLG